MTTNIDRAAKIIADAFRPAMRGHADSIGEQIADNLAAAGLLAPEPQIIRTREELAALDRYPRIRNR